MLSFSTAQCYFPLSLWCKFSQWIHGIRSLPINTCHSFFYIQWKLAHKSGKKVDVAKEQCKIITKKTLELNLTVFTWRHQPRSCLTSLRAQIWTVQYAMLEKKIRFLSKHHYIIFAWRKCAYLRLTKLTAVYTVLKDNALYSKFDKPLCGQIDAWTSHSANRVQ